METKLSKLFIGDVFYFLNDKAKIYIFAGKKVDTYYFYHSITIKESELNDQNVIKL